LAGPDLLPAHFNVLYRYAAGKLNRRLVSKKLFHSGGKKRPVLSQHLHLRGMAKQGKNSGSD
jgi:hypothetical protein